VPWYLWNKLSAVSKTVSLPPCRRQGERKFTSYSFLTSALYWVSGQRHALAALYPWYPSDGRLGGPQSWSGHRGYRKCLCLCWGLNPGHPACSQTLYWLSYPSSQLSTIRTYLFSYLAAVGQRIATVYLEHLFLSTVCYCSPITCTYQTS
jgi:hypothetical protein